MKQLMLGCCACLAVVLVGVPAHALEPLVLYDDFNAPLINPDKWFGAEFVGAGTEAIRLIQGKKLHLFLRGYGNTISDTGVTRSELELLFAHPATVTAIEATVQVKKFEAPRCTSNLSPTFVQARVAGNFFNTATPIPGSRTNDVLACIEIGRRSTSTDPPNVLRVTIGVFHCQDDRCVTFTVLDFRDLGPVTQRQKVKLLLQWDQANHQFIFQQDDEPEVLSRYTVSDTVLASNLAKGFTVFDIVPNCTTASRPVGFMEAFFDNVFVNASAAP